ncbi:MAG: hypothetical protein PVI81_09745 [Anaerolineales bacterium]|jgi:hypothetical protein
MSENEKSPGWLLPVIVTVLLGSVLLIFIASRRTENEVTRSQSRFRQGDLTYTLPDVSSPTDPVDPCSLITEEEAEQILGVELSSPTSRELDDAAGQIECVFTDADQSDQQVLVIGMVFNRNIDQVLLDNGYNAYEFYLSRKLPEKVITMVPEIKDEAFWGGTGDEVWNGLHVIFADVYFRVGLSLQDDELAFDAAQEIAVTLQKNLYE